VLLIIGLRLQGKSKEEIATELGLKPATINQYMFFAGRNGWLKKTAIDPSDRLEHEVMHKVVRNIDEALDSDDEERRDRMTVKAAEGVLFPRYKEQATEAAAPMMMIGVRIEMPNIPGTPAPTVREGTTGGEPLWKEGEVEDGTVTGS
jgi:isopentenyldiphosphate isomerase